MDSTLNSFAYTKMIVCPFAIKWEIHKNKLVAMKESKNGYLTTKWFNASNIPDVQFCFKIAPNGNKEKNRGKVWISLHLKLGNEKKIKADFKFLIDSVDFIKKHNVVLEKSEGWGGSRFTTADLFDPEKKFIIGGKLTLKCQGTLKVERQVAEADITNKWKDHSFLIKLWERNDQDFAINVNGKTLQAHKCILAAHSTAFDGMFNSGMKEAAENTLGITDFSYETVELALELLYDRKPSTLTMEEKIDVLLFLDKYDIQDLKDSLELLLAEDISLINVVNIATFSITANSLKLQERCMNFMVACLRMDRPIDDFDNLNETFALKVLKSVNFDIVKT